MIRLNIRGLGVIAATAFLAASASAASEDIDASVKLRRCGEQTCMRISGHRPDPAAPIWVEQHEVTAVGGRRWHVTLPLQVVRQWSAPAARSIAVAVGGQNGRATQAALPIGVFGHTTELAFLNVDLRR